MSVSLVERKGRAHEAASPDHKPIIELNDEPRGLGLAVGHSRRGISYAAGTGDLVMEFITGRGPSLPSDAFSSARFGATAEASAHGGHR